MSESPWTEERVELLRRLRAQGVACSKIAAALSMTGHKFTRNAVIAKCDRLGLIKDGARNQTKQQYAKALGRAIPPLIAEDRSRETGAPRGPWNVRFMDRDESTCLMFVGGESHETGLICGRAVFGDKPYCKACCKLAYLPPETKRRAA